MGIKKIEIRQKIRQKIRTTKVDILSEIDDVMSTCYFGDANGNLTISDKKLDKNAEILSTLDYELDLLATSLLEKRMKIKSWVTENEILRGSE